MTQDKNTDQSTATEATRMSGGETFTLSRDPGKAMQEMMETIDDMRDVYLEENEALLEADTSRFLALQSKKIDITHNYQQGVLQLHNRKDEFKSLGPELRENLEKKHKEFSRIATDNLKALENVRNAIGRLNDRIMVSVRENAKKDGVNYDPRGAMHENGRCVSIGLNESA